ncbi:cyclase family protein [Microvirga sp. P5_D2]
MSDTQRWKKRPPGSNWGDFGPDDQFGRANWLTPDVTLKGIAEVREGRSFCLSLPLDYPGGNAMNPSRRPPILKPTMRRGKPCYGYKMLCEDPTMTDVLNDDIAILTLQYSTQWDALGHVGSMFDADDDGEPEIVFYNGFRAGVEIIGPSETETEGSTVAAHALSIDRLAEKSMQGRGVMIDLAHHLGRERVAVGYDLLMRIMEDDGVEVERGDMVCLHTGLSTMILEMNKQPDGPLLLKSCPVLDGRDQRLLQWVTDSGLVAIAADNYAVELNPGRDQQACCSYLPLHEHCLFKLGIPLGELWYLDELARWLRAHGRSRFLLTAPPLRLPGAIGSPVTPIATV